MTTNIKTNDIRKDTAPTFEDIEVGSMFTEPDGEIIFIKLNEIQIHYYGNVKQDVVANEEGVYNAITLDSDFETFSDDEEVQPIQELEITIKK